MPTVRQPNEDLLDVARVLLLLQGAVLVATTIEALIWGVIFAGAAGLPAMMSGTAAAIALVARARLRADRSWTRRLVYGVEGFTLATLAIDTALAIAITGAYPPPVALLTRLVLPLSLVLLLRRTTGTAVAPTSANGAGALEGVS